jgi:hypothetical protein
MEPDQSSRDEARAQLSTGGAVSLPPSKSIARGQVTYQGISVDAFVRCDEATSGTVSAPHRRSRGTDAANGTAGGGQPEAPDAPPCGEFP